MIYALLALGVLLALAGTIVLLIAAFRVSLFWGLISLLAPLGILVFTGVHWSKAKRGFLLQLAALPFFIGGVTLAAQQDNAQLAQVLAGNFDLSKPLPVEPAPAPDPTPEPTPVPPPAPLPPEIFQARWDANQRRFTELATAYTRMTARRNMLRTSDPEAVRAFNDEVALYVADLTAAQAEKRELAARRPRP